MKALAVCHNVTPVMETGPSSSSKEATLHLQGDAQDSEEEEDEEEEIIFENEGSERKSKGISYQASSPDEVSITIVIF